MSEWKEEANYRRDVRHGLLNAQDETPRLPKATRHDKGMVEVEHVFHSWTGKDWITKTRFPNMKRAQDYVQRMNQKEANRQISSGVHPEDVKLPYRIADSGAANDDHAIKAA